MCLSKVWPSSSILENVWLLRKLTGLETLVIVNISEEFLDNVAHYI
jgi:hypothetical protein